MKLVIILIFGAQLIFAQKVPLINIPDGKVQGNFDKSYNGRIFMQFIGIPYAQPPIGNLRFADPLPNKSWRGTLIANQTSQCSQIFETPAGGDRRGQEDCLYLDVYIPGKQIEKSRKFDVIIHIHGGAFSFTGKDVYAGPKYLLDRDIILVTINYRLGVMGFLSTGDSNIPGNFGMKDQVLALKWVKNNIKYFGGNPNSITITGLSAGGASVHYHYISPMSKGLFNAGIAVSGCALNPWTIQEAPLEKAKKIGMAVGCDEEHTDDLLACLRSRSADSLTDATKVLRSWYFNPFSPLALVVDAKFTNNPFLPIHPYQALINKNVSDLPLLFTAATSEGLYPAADFSVNDDYFQDLEKKWDILAPEILHYYYTIPVKKHAEYAEKARKYYMQNRKVNKSTYLETIQLIGDRLFMSGIELAVKLHSNAVKSPIHYYMFNYTGIEVISISEFLTGNPVKYGVAHGDDMLYIFSIKDGKPLKKMIQIDEDMKNFLLDLWKNFASNKIQNYLQQWKPIRKNFAGGLNIMKINSPRDLQFLVVNDLGKKSFWDTIPFKENQNL